MDENFRSHYDCTGTPADYGLAFNRLHTMQKGDTFSVTAEIGFLWALWSVGSRRDVLASIELVRDEQRYEVSWLNSGHKRGYTHLKFEYEAGLTGEMDVPSAMVFTMDFVCNEENF